MKIVLTAEVSVRKGNQVKVSVCGNGETITCYGAYKNIGRMVGGLAHNLVKKARQEIKEPAKTIVQQANYATGKTNNAVVPAA